MLLLLPSNQRTVPFSSNDERINKFGLNYRNLFIGIYIIGWFINFFFLPTKFAIFDFLRISEIKTNLEFCTNKRAHVNVISSN